MIVALATSAVFPRSEEVDVVEHHVGIDLAPVLRDKGTDLRRAVGRRAKAQHGRARQRKWDFLLPAGRSCVAIGNDCERAGVRALHSLPQKLLLDLDCE